MLLELERDDPSARIVHELVANVAHAFAECAAVDVSAGQTIIINIPTRSNLCLVGSESTLKFSLTTTNSGTDSNYIRLDRGGASGVVQRLRLYSGSNLLEDVDNYGLLMSNLVSLQKFNASVRDKFNIITNGTRNDDIVEFNTTTPAAGNVLGTNNGSGRSDIYYPDGEKLWSTTETYLKDINSGKLSCGCPQ